MSSFTKVSMLLREIPDATKMAKLGDFGPLERITSILAFELGKLQGENYMLREQLKAAGVLTADSDSMGADGLSCATGKIRPEAWDELSGSKTSKGST